MIRQSDDETLQLAIPKGRMYDGVARLLAEAGIDLSFAGDGIDEKGVVTGVREIDGVRAPCAPGAEVVLFTAKGAYAWIPSAGERARPRKLAVADFLWQLPGEKDPERAKNLIGRTARLEFRLVQSQEATEAALTRLDDAFRAVGVPDPDADDDESHRHERVGRPGRGLAGCRWADLPGHASGSTRQ